MASLISDTIVFFNSEIGANNMAHLNGGAENGFFVAVAKGRPGKFVIEVRDTDDGFFLGYL